MSDPVSAAFVARVGQYSEPGGFAAVTVDEALKTRPDKKGLTWIALTVQEPEAAKDVLQEKFGFHPVAIDDALSDKERPGYFFGEDYVFATLSLVTGTQEGTKYTHLGLFVCPHCLVSVTTLGSDFVNEWFDRWKAHPKEIGTASDMLMSELIDAAIDDYFPALDRIQGELDRLEEGVYRGARPDVSAAIRLRRNLLEMRRQVTPTRDILNGLLRRDSPVIKRETWTYLQDCYDHTLRVLEGIDLNRDILTSIMDAQLSVTSNRLNEVMRNMTSIATILMLMTLVTSIYGMNFKYMPELDWADGYFLVLGVLAVIGVGGIAVATKVGWFTVKWPWRLRSRGPKSNR
ncbi:MAG: magnesium/cobalt transporter CorA [Armatimonadetes bacterium]|nr:magnesium/cobalt transporter CorA [Armatimonadota bacterium]